MVVGLVGSGPAAEAVRTALSDVDAETVQRDAESLEGLELAVVVGRTGDRTFRRANSRALDRGLRWFAVELGGVGGAPVVDAAVAGFGPGSGCYECLCGRVSANLDSRTDGESDATAHTARFAGAVAGREAVRHALGGEARFGHVVEIPHAVREFLPLPNCACGTGQTSAPSRTAGERELEAALARAERAVDSRLGVVQEVGEAESFPVPYYLAHACDTEGFSDVGASRDAAGVAPGWNAAFMKALGEGLERYCAGVYRESQFETGRPSDLPGVVPPSAFVCDGPVDADAERTWVRGEHLATGDEVWLPAEFVYYPPPASGCRPPTTTGLGLGNSGVGALLAGLTEVVERDAAVLSWYSTFDPLGLDVSDPGYQTLVDRAHSESLSVTALLLTQDVDVPVVAAAVSREEWPSFAVGSDADLNPERAARSALAEALQNWTELRGMGPDDAAETPGAIGRYAEFPPEAREFVDPVSVVPAASVGPENSPDGEEALSALAGALDAAGLDTYGVRTTTRDVETLGFEAVRTLVPGAQPLFFDEAYFGERAETAPRSLGFEPDPDRSHHPFP